MPETEQTPAPELVERIAPIVHAAMTWAARQSGDPQPWQGGNSHAEERARCAAREIAARRTPAASPTPAELVEAAAEIIRTRYVCNAEEVASRILSLPGIAAGRTAGEKESQRPEWTLAGVQAEMLAVARADDESEIAQEWPSDCRADVDRWQAVIRKAAIPVDLDDPRVVADFGLHGKYHRGLLELLTVIHRDGGHKTEEIGLDLSIQQALRLSAERIAATHPDTEMVRRVDAMKFKSAFEAELAKGMADDYWLENAMGAFDRALDAASIATQERG